MLGSGLEVTLQASAVERGGDHTMLWWRVSDAGALFRRVKRAWCRLGGASPEESWIVARLTGLKAWPTNMETEAGWGRNEGGRRKEYGSPRRGELI